MPPKTIYHTIYFQGFHPHSPRRICHYVSAIKGVYWNMWIELTSMARKNWVPIIKKYLALWRQKCHIRVIIPLACKWPYSFFKVQMPPQTTAPAPIPEPGQSGSSADICGLILLTTLECFWFYSLISWGNFFYYMCIKAPPHQKYVLGLY